MVAVQSSTSDQLAPIVGSVVSALLAAYYWYKFEQMSDQPPLIVNRISAIGVWLSKPPSGKLPQWAQRALTFIENGLVLTTFGFIGLVGFQIPPVLYLWGLLIVLGLHRSKALTGASRILQTGLYLVLCIGLYIGISQLNVIVQGKLTENNRSFARLVASLLPNQQSTSAAPSDEHSDGNGGKERFPTKGQPSDRPAFDLVDLDSLHQLTLINRSSGRLILLEVQLRDNSTRVSSVTPLSDDIAGGSVYTHKFESVPVIFLDYSGDWETLYKKSIDIYGKCLVAAFLSNDSLTLKQLEEHNTMGGPPGYGTVTLRYRSIDSSQSHQQTFPVRVVLGHKEPCTE